MIKKLALSLFVSYMSCAISMEVAKEELLIPLAVKAVESPAQNEDEGSKAIEVEREKTANDFEIQGFWNQLNEWVVWVQGAIVPSSARLRDDLKLQKLANAKLALANAKLGQLGDLQQNYELLLLDFHQNAKRLILALEQNLEGQIPELDQNLEREILDQNAEVLRSKISIAQFCIKNAEIFSIAAMEIPREVDEKLFEVVESCLKLDKNVLSKLNKNDILDLFHGVYANGKIELFLRVCKMVLDFLDKGYRSDNGAIEILDEAIENIKREYKYPGSFELLRDASNMVWRKEKTLEEVLIWVKQKEKRADKFVEEVFTGQIDSTLAILSEDKSIINGLDSTGRSALHVVIDRKLDTHTVMKARLDTIQILLNHGADPKVKNRASQTPIEALDHSMQSGKEEERVVRTLKFFKKAIEKVLNGLNSEDAWQEYLREIAMNAMGDAQKVQNPLPERWTQSARASLENERVALENEEEVIGIEIKKNNERLLWLQEAIAAKEKEIAEGRKASGK